MTRGAISLNGNALREMTPALEFPPAMPAVTPGHVALATELALEVLAKDGQPQFNCALGLSESRSRGLVSAFGGIPTQRVFELSRDLRRLKVAGQNLTIGRVVTVEFPVSFLIRAKRRAFQRDTRE